MNPAPPEMYYSQHPPAQPQPPQAVSSGAMPYHSQHPAPLLQPTTQYSAPTPYSNYGYANGLTSPPTGAPVSAPMGGPNVLPLPGVGSQPGLQNQYQGFDTTGQVAPPGMKPRVTATLWEDEGSLCFQVEARGICVARREDNHMINGTKLLNVAGMTRGRRDGILKSEKVRHVVKIGPMHLKGVWIPFERALDFANKEKITELLYPLFVHNIGALLYHPTNQTRTTQVMAAAERRKQEQNQVRMAQPPSAGLPSLGQHHHHSLSLPGGQAPLPSHPSMGGRPSLDRAHTFPTPPTSASSVLGGMGASDGYQWSQPQATTPPGTTLQSMQSYPPATQPYDSSRQLYNAPAAQQSPYQQTQNSSPQDRSLYGQPTYGSKEMGPPSGRPAGTGPEPVETKPNGILHPGQGGEQVGHPGGEEEAEHDHDAEYTHDSGTYDANRAAYNYNAPPVASLPSDHPHLSPEMTGSAAHQAASGRSTPRSAAAPQSYYAPQGYSTPPRAPQSSSNLYSVMSNDRASTNGGAADVYAPPSDMAGSIQNGYGAPVMNGASGGLKRGREDDDDRPSSGGAGLSSLDLKRRKTMLEGSVSSPVYDTSLNRPASAIATQQRRR